MQVRALGQEEPLEEGTAAHRSVLAWRTPWTEEPGGDSPQGPRVRHDGATQHSTPSAICEQINSSQI